MRSADDNVDVVGKNLLYELLHEKKTIYELIKLY